MRVIDGCRVFDPGEVITSEKVIEDPVVVQAYGLPPMQVSRSVLAKEMQLLGWKTGESTFLREARVSSPSGDVLAVLRAIRASF